MVKSNTNTGWDLTAACNSSHQHRQYSVTRSPVYDWPIRFFGTRSSWQFHLKPDSWKSGILSGIYTNITQIRLCWPLCAFRNYIYLLTYSSSPITLHLAKVYSPKAVSGTKCTKIIFGWGSALDPAGEDLLTQSTGDGDTPSPYTAKLKNESQHIT